MVLERIIHSLGQMSTAIPLQMRYELGLHLMGTDTYHICIKYKATQKVFSVPSIMSVILNACHLMCTYSQHVTFLLKADT